MSPKNLTPEPYLVSGRWDIVGLSGVVGAHAALLHTGEVLFFTRPEQPSHRVINEKINGLPGDRQRGSNERDVTVSTVIETFGPNAYTPAPVHAAYNPFCAGHTFLPDGRLFVAGGDKKDCDKHGYSSYAGVPLDTGNGLKRLQTFTPGGAGGGWNHVGNMSDGRWYPTCTLLPDGRVFIVSGSLDDMQNYNNQNPTCEYYPNKGAVTQYLHFLTEAWPYHSYPFVFSLPSGDLFVFVKDSAYFLSQQTNAFGKEYWHVEDGPKLPKREQSVFPFTDCPSKHYPNNATAVLLPLLPEKEYSAAVLLLGGAGANIYTHFSGVMVPDVNTHTHHVDAVRDAYYLNVDEPYGNSKWEPIASMNLPRVMPDAVLLPDGTVLVVNGAKKGFAGGDPATGPVLAEFATLEAELFNPDRNTWELMGKAHCPRLYHSTALLLPDATVLVAGSDHQANADRPVKVEGSNRNTTIAQGYEYSLEVFSPPYLFRGIPQPEISVSQQECKVLYGQKFRVTVSNFRTMKSEERGYFKAAFLRPGSVTHNNNMSQRHVGLRIFWDTPVNENELQLEAPPTPNIAPPGYYMLFVVYKGVPSKAVMVQLLPEPTLEAATSGLSSGALSTNSYSPKDMSLWLRSDRGIGFSDSDSAITSWSDLSGQNNHVYWRPNSKRNPNDPIPLDRRPRLLLNCVNGHPAVEFFLLDVAGTQWGGRLESAESFLPGSTKPYTMFLVTHPWPSGNLGPERRGTPGLISWGDSANSFFSLSLGPSQRSGSPPSVEGFDNHLAKEQGKLALVMSWGANQLTNDTKHLVSFPKTVLLEASFAGGMWQIKVNGKTVAGPQPVDKPSETGKGPLVIGVNPVAGQEHLSYGDFFSGYMTEVLVYDRTCDEEERLSIQSYLRSRYALW
jgi:hypothetical protein